MDDLTRRVNENRELKFDLYEKMIEEAEEAGMEHVVIDAFCREILQHLTSEQVFNACNTSLNLWSIRA